MIDQELAFPAFHAQLRLGHIPMQACTRTQTVTMARKQHWQPPCRTPTPTPEAWSWGRCHWRERRWWCGSVCPPGGTCTPAPSTATCRYPGHPQPAPKTTVGAVRGGGTGRKITHATAGHQFFSIGSLPCHPLTWQQSALLAKRNFTATECMGNAQRLARRSSLHCSLTACSSTIHSSASVVRQLRSIIPMPTAQSEVIH